MQQVQQHHYYVSDPLLYLPNTYGPGPVLQSFLRLLNSRERQKITSCRFLPISHMSGYHVLAFASKYVYTRLTVTVNQLHPFSFHPRATASC